MTKIDVKIDFDDERIKNKLHMLTDEDTLIQAHNLLAKTVNDYVPYLNGPLSQTIDVSADGVTYHMPYARYQYYGVNFNHTLTVHPLASAMWDKAAFADREEEFLQGLSDIISKKLR